EPFIVHSLIVPKADRLIVTYSNATADESDEENSLVGYIYGIGFHKLKQDIRYKVNWFHYRFQDTWEPINNLSRQEDSIKSWMLIFHAHFAEKYYNVEANETDFFWLDNLNVVTMDLNEDLREEQFNEGNELEELELVPFTSPDEMKNDDTTKKKNQRMRRKKKQSNLELKEFCCSICDRSFAAKSNLAVKMLLNAKLVGEN
ncbi:unnamed protein product, partial [Allacma fusca]